MSNNSKIIAYLDESFRKNNIDSISYLFSPNFAFHINGGKKRSFKEFADLMKQVSKHIEIIGDKMVSKDDIHFCTEFELPLRVENNEIIIKIGFIEVEIHNCIIKSFNLHHRPQKSETEEFRQAVKPNIIAYV